MTGLTSRVAALAVTYHIAILLSLLAYQTTNAHPDVNRTRYCVSATISTAGHPRCMWSGNRRTWVVQMVLSTLLTPLGQCSMLQWWLKDKVLFPKDHAYSSSVASYWSEQQSTLAPSCIVLPQNSKDVSRALWVLGAAARYTSYLAGTPCLFAIRGGGHTPYAGSSNIEQGVTIDLSFMKDVTVNDERTVTSIGPGARWLDVYLKLDSMDLAVSGGRVSSVGVAGLTLGGLSLAVPYLWFIFDAVGPLTSYAGGLSFFSPRYGFVCDNVQNFEIVLAQGEVINANSRENADLWFALKGGSSNFGVVTRFDLKTFEQGDFWGGFIVYPIETRLEHFKAFEQLNAAAEYDVHTSLINNYAYTAGVGWVIANNYEYTKAESYPAVFEPFTSIQPQFANTMRISNLSDFTIEMNDQTSKDIRYYAPSPSNASRLTENRKQFVTTSFKNSAALLEKVFDLSNSTLQSLLPCKELSWYLSYQGIPASISKQSASTGGNALGIDPSEGSLVLVLLTLFWRDAADDARIDDATKNMFQRIDDMASEMGLGTGWKYLNYAARWQNPIDGYGAENKKKLQDVSRKYDPQGVFQRHVPGGFKLFS